MKVIAYPSATGVLITSLAPRDRELKAAAAQVAALDAEIAQVQSRLASYPARAASEAELDDRKALSAKIDDLREQKNALAPLDDDAYAQAHAERMYPGGGFILVAREHLPSSGEPTTDWTIADGRVVLK